MRDQIGKIKVYSKRRDERGKIKERRSKWTIWGEVNSTFCYG